jgi:signal transduction histidine kinase
VGLSLSITKHLVELHNGTIHADSAGPGQGSQFYVSLPLASPD